MVRAAELMALSTMAAEGRREGVICSDSQVTGGMGCVSMCESKFCRDIKFKGLWASPGQCPDALEYKSRDW